MELEWETVVGGAAVANAPRMAVVGFGYRRVDDSLMAVGDLASGTTIGTTSNTWAFDQRTWRQVNSAKSEECVHHYGGAAENTLRDAIVFFGGYSCGSTATWDGASWTVSTPNPSPSIRGNEAGAPAMAYDPDHQVVLLFGGVGNGTYFNDTWAWDAAAWTRIG